MALAVSPKEEDMKGEFSEDAPCHTQAGAGGEEIKPHGYSPKEIWQARQIDDQDRGGIPNPQEVDMARNFVYMSDDRRIVARKGNQERRYVGRRIDAGHKSQMEAAGWKFLAALKDGGDVTVKPSGQVTVSRHGGRAYAPPGYVIQARRGELSTRLGKTCAEAAWKQAGWALSLVAA